MASFQECLNECIKNNHISGYTDASLIESAIQNYISVCTEVKFHFSFTNQDHQRGRESHVMAQKTPEAVPDKASTPTAKRTEALSTKTESKFTTSKKTSTSKVPTQLTVSEEVSYGHISVCSAISKLISYECRQPAGAICGGGKTIFEEKFDEGSATRRMEGNLCCMGQSEQTWKTESWLIGTVVGHFSFGHRTAGVLLWVVEFRAIPRWRPYSGG